MGDKSPQASSHWSLLAIIDRMQDSDCLATGGDDLGFVDGTASRSRSSLLTIDGVGGERPADDTALPTRRQSRLSSPCGTARRAGLTGRLLRGTCPVRR